MSVQEVLKLSKKITKYSRKHTSEYIGVFETLERLKNVRMTTEILKKTHIGMIVNMLRKNTTNDKVVIICKDLLRQWKNNISTATPSISSQNNDTEENKRSERSRTPLRSPHQEEKETHPNNSRMNTTDPTRLKSRQLFRQSFTKYSIPDDSADIDVLSNLIECGVYDIFNHTDQKYRATIRSRVLNLRDPNNPKLRENVLMGRLSPNTFANMTSIQMASDEMKKLRQQFTKESIDDHQVSVQVGTETDMIKCGKCKSRKCTYNQEKLKYKQQFVAK
ncbi:hypothetical protein A3Q56_01445 [Intoshia linei]|uniref:Uncharacterized protein n=1 Tax=Intoshia linei TaxID=1819745 RepID=A0A177B930_9BILA|nr:hypothetical protein A3Q56_01445 [Intoshia linei]